MVRNRPWRAVSFRKVHHKVAAVLGLHVPRTLRGLPTPRFATVPFRCAGLALCLLPVGWPNWCQTRQRQLSYEDLVDQVTTLLEEHPDDLEVARKAMQLQDNINAIYDR